MDVCRNADKSGNGEVETGCLCSGRRLSFISSNARGLHSGKRLRGTRADWEREFHGGGACGVPREFTILPLAGGKVSALRKSSSICAGAGERGSPGRRASENFLVYRPARVLRNHFPLCNPRAYTPVIATVPIFNIRARFCNTSEFRCILSFPPRPSPQSGRAEGIPVGRQSLPQGEPFPAFSLAKTFSSSLGKEVPAEQKQTMIARKESEVKLQSLLLRSKNKQ